MSVSCKWPLLLAAVLAACGNDACAAPKNQWPARKGTQWEPWQPSAQPVAPATPLAEGAQQAVSEPVAPAALRPGEKQRSSLGVNIGQVT